VELGLRKRKKPQQTSEEQLLAKSMRILCAYIPFILLHGCSPASEGPSMANMPEAESTRVSGSFDIRNKEIRDEMIQMIEEAGIEYWVGENGAIHYNLADGIAIDKIGNEVISEYITRN
jgi:hypothetical protein